MKRAWWNIVSMEVQVFKSVKLFAKVGMAKATPSDGRQPGVKMVDERVWHFVFVPWIRRCRDFQATKSTIDRDKMKRRVFSFERINF